MKPFSDACDENKVPILQVIQSYFAKATSVLEIGSGTGQHAVFFAEKMPQLQWHCSDQLIHHPGINQWLVEYTGTNITGPHNLDVKQASWPVPNKSSAHFSGIFSANTTHIMSWPEVELMFTGISKCLASEDGAGDGEECSGYFCLYGPFNYDGAFTSTSNEQFDRFLKARDPQSGIRDLNDLRQLASQVGMTLINDHEMPVNNRILVWKKD